MSIGQVAPATLIQADPGRSLRPTSAMLVSRLFSTGYGEIFNRTEGWGGNRLYEWQRGPDPASIRLVNPAFGLASFHSIPLDTDE